MRTHSKSTLLKTAGALLVVAIAAACGSSKSGGGGGISPTPTLSTATPTVISNTPLADATDVALNPAISATFSEGMEASTLTTGTFTLTSGASASPVAGTVTYTGTVASFFPASQLSSNGSFTATITIGAKSAAGVALAAQQSWNFTTGNTVGPEAPVNLGSAGGFVVLAKSAISTVPSSAVTGNMGISPAAASFITGFSLTAAAGNVFSTSHQVTGKVFAADYAPPTPVNLTTAIGDMQTAYTAAAGRAAAVTELGAGNIGGMTLSPGVYAWSSAVVVPTSVTLNGSATDVWVFQIAQDLTMSSATQIILTGGAVPQNVFWQIAGLVDIGTTAHCEGIVMSKTSITLGTGASINGMLMAQTAVNLNANTVTTP
jgi:Ice-binding-like/Bacterial Ig-like domain